jgi:type IV fimbrial biogenesis protein FimT
MSEGTETLIHAARAAAGFTLVELLVVLLVGAILVGLGVPAMQGVIADNHLNAVTDDFASALNNARSEAGKLGANVRLTATSGAKDWGAGGWTMNVLNPDGSLGALLRQGSPFPPAYSLNSSFSGSLAFDSTGRLVSRTAGEFVICQGGGPWAGPGGAARMITVMPSGRVRIAQNDPTSRKPIDDAGNPIAGCAP